MNEIAYIIPGTGMDADELARRERVANDLVEPAVDIFKTDQGPVAVESEVDHKLAVPGILSAIDRNEEDYDSFVIGCFSDPGLRAAREFIEKPVIGPGETAFHTAAMLADRFSCLTIRDTPNALHRAVHKNHLDSKLASVEVLELDVTTIVNSPDDAYAETVEKGGIAVLEENADAIVPGCMSLAFEQFHDSLATELDVPVVDPLSIALETADMWTRLELGQNRRAHPSFDDRGTQYFGQPTGPS